MDYSAAESRFLDSLDPLDVPGLQRQVPEEILTMLSCGIKTDTGPMASVAGLFAQYVGQKLLGAYGLKEVMVENGGDLYVFNAAELISVIHAGTSSLSDRMAFMLPEGEWGICTSSGTVGHSLSYGQADAVIVIARSAVLADAAATAIGNLVKKQEDITGGIEFDKGIEELMGVVIIKDDKMGIWGGVKTHQICV